MSPDGVLVASRGPLLRDEGVWRAVVEGSSGANLGFKGAQIESFGNSGCPPLTRKDTKCGTEGNKQTKLEFKGDPKSPSRASLHSKCCCIKNICFINVKSKFMRVMGVRWRGQQRHREAPG